MMFSLMTTLMYTSSPPPPSFCFSFMIGAHIRAIRGKFQGLSGGLYDHHMLVIEVVSETDIRVIHYTGGVENHEEGGALGFTSATSFSVLGVGRGGEGTGVVAEEVIKVEPEDLKCLELLQYTDDVIPFPPDKSIERARGRLNERNYGVFHNNCECFVNWAVIDKAISYQVVDGTVASVMGAVKGAKETYGNTGGSMMGAIAGGFRGLFQGYQQHREKRQ